MSKEATNDSLGYQAPHVSEIFFISEGLLCSSTQLGETTDLQTSDLDDIWY